MKSLVGFPLVPARLRINPPPRAERELRPARKPNPALRSIARYRAYLDTLDESFPPLEWGLRWCELNAPSCEGVAAEGTDSRVEHTYWQVMDQLGASVIALQQAPAIAPQAVPADEVNRVHRKLSNAIRDGLFDAPGARQQMLMATLTQIGRAKLASFDRKNQDNLSSGKETQ